MSRAATCTAPAPEWIWCDDFEQDRLHAYFEYRTAHGSFRREPGVGRDGSYGMRAHWEPGQVDAGFLHLALGRTPGAYFRPVDDGQRMYRELYWRLYLRLEPGWTGGGADKLSRAVVFADTSWAEAAIAHVWSGGSAHPEYLVLEPASGTDSVGRVRTTHYNDFEHLRWIGGVRGRTPIFATARAGTWVCIEAHARLNEPGAHNGEFELWIDGQPDAQRTGLDFVGRYRAYGFNAVFFENWWNRGAPRAEDRYFDDIVVATARIGC